MFFDYENYKYYIKPGATALRGGADYLVRKIEEEMDLNPFDKAMFLFCNKNSKLIKVVVWDGNGYWLLSKKLQIGTFKWPNDEKAALEVTIPELKLLLLGADVTRRIPRSEIGMIY